MKEENMQHWNFDVISEWIEKYSDFILIHTKSHNTLSDRYYISPMEIHGNHWTKFGSCYDNTDIHGNEIMSVQEMVMRFNLIYGKKVTYKCDIVYDDNDHTIIKNFGRFTKRYHFQ